MKAIYSQQTQDLIDSLNQHLDYHIEMITNKLKERNASPNRVSVELQCNPTLNKIRSELTRVYQVALPIRYEFAKEEFERAIPMPEAVDHVNTKSNEDSEFEMVYCASCGKPNETFKMKVTMQAQMHRYVCNEKCMSDLYK